MTLPQPVVTSGVEEELPRPEYPRPQFVRREWLNLNGPWQFQLDDDNAGLAEKWFNATRFTGRIIVPFSLESARSGIGDRTFHPCVWYLKHFQIPATWSSNRVLLNFGAVDYRATVWINGAVVATHEGGHTPFSCDITGSLLKDDNIVIVRAEDPPDDRYIPRGKQHWEPEPAGIFYARTTGIWQTVWLEPVPYQYLESVRITPRIDGDVAFEFRLVSPAIGSSSITVAVSRHDRQLATGTGMVDGPRAAVSIHIAEPKLWSPNSPELYAVRIEVNDPSGTSDVIETYFGFRSIDTQDGKILLNGEPIILKTVLDQGYWPDSNLTPPSDEAIRQDILWAKELGFNGVRKHQKVEDPRFLYWADKLGLMVSAEMANAYLFSPQAVARMTREWIEVVNRDYNHPSIVIWVPVNESWGVPNLRDPRQQAHLKALYYLTKSLDDTRLVIDNDGWEHTEATDLFAIHDYTTTGEELARRFQNLQRGPVPSPLYGRLYLAPGYRYNGSPLFMSEFGGIGYIPPRDIPCAEPGSWGYSGIEATQQSALERMRGLFTAIAQIPQIAGVCYTQLYDVEKEVNGLMTYDRRMKFDPAAVRSITSLLV